MKNLFKILVLLLVVFVSCTPKPLTIEVVHADGSKDIISVNHTYNNSQIEWFNEGSALNLIKKQNA